MSAGLIYSFPSFVQITVAILFKESQSHSYCSVSSLCSKVPNFDRVYFVAFLLYFSPLRSRIQEIDNILNGVNMGIFVVMDCYVRSTCVLPIAVLLY